MKPISCVCTVVFACVIKSLTLCNHLITQLTTAQPWMWSHVLLVSIKKQTSAGKKKMQNRKPCIYVKIIFFHETTLVHRFLCKRHANKKYIAIYNVYIMNISSRSYLPGWLVICRICCEVASVCVNFITWILQTCNNACFHLLYKRF